MVTAELMDIPTATRKNAMYTFTGVRVRVVGLSKCADYSSTETIHGTTDT